MLTKIEQLETGAPRKPPATLPRLTCASRARAAKTELSSKVEAADARVEGAKRARAEEFLTLQLKVARLEGQVVKGMSMAKCMALGMTMGNGNSNPGNFNSPATGPSIARAQGVMGTIDALFQPDGVD